MVRAATTKSKRLFLISFALLCGTLFCLAPSAEATNYFNWGVETPANNATSLGITGTYWLSPWSGNTVQDCSVSHSGSCSMRMTVVGQDGGNQQAGPDTIGHAQLPFTAQAVSGSGSIYYRTWVRYAADFNWGVDGVANVKTSRASNGDMAGSMRFFTGHMRSDGFYMAECEFVDGFGGGCLTTAGVPNNDYNISIPYDVQGKADGQWHEYIWRIKPNTGLTSNAEMEVFVDGVSIGSLPGWRLATQNSAWWEAWGGWMARPYWQMNGDASVGGQVWVDDVSTDDTFNSLLGGSDTAPPAAPTELAVE
jgi:hypothetical protein